MKATANGIAIHYDVTGSGPWVTLSHSLSTDISMWEPQVAALASRYTVLRFDTRGHGASAVPPAPYTLEEMAQDVLGLWDALGIERSHFVGLSMGGMIGQHVALAAPGRLASLTLADTTSRYPAEARVVWPERIRVVREQGMGALVESTLARWFTEPYRQTHPELMAKIGALIRSTPVEGFVGCCHAIPAIDVTERLRALALPALVMVGADDAGTPPEWAREIASALPGARLEIIPDAAHLSSIQQAEAFNRLLLNFLAAA
jgi:3-oxoadipate enol-lactonase